MKIFAPDYYKKFKCIADKCKHNCCIGWEIDIDNETLAKYQEVKSDFSDELMQNITQDEDSPRFCLDGKGRCAFLNDNNLCKIILNLGEEYLCQICEDHPRFRNFFEDRTEIGLGLCCEKAAEIILTQKGEFTLEETESDNEAECYDENELHFFEERERIFTLLQNNKTTLENRVKELINSYNLTFPNITFREMVDIFLSLERLDECWTNILNDSKLYSVSDVILPSRTECYFEKLILYFLYRHLPEGIYESTIEKEIQFSLTSLFFIYSLCKYHYAKYQQIEVEDIIEIARMYSSEIEYSSENKEKLINSLFLYEKIS